MNNQDKLTLAAAENIATMLMQSFPATTKLPHESQTVLFRQLASIMTGKSIEEGNEVVHPETGVPGKCRELTAFELNRWLEKRFHKIVSSPKAFRPQLEAPHKVDPVEAERRQIIAAAHKMSCEEGIKLSDLLRQAVDSSPEGSEIRHALEKSVKRFDHLPAPRKGKCRQPIMAYKAWA